MNVYRCPECGLEYDPEERAARIGCSIEEVIELTPAHHMPTGEALLCEGTNWPPDVSRDEDVLT